MPVTKDDYKAILKRGLAKEELTELDFYYYLEEGELLRIEVLDKWLAKAQKYFEGKDFEQAIAISQAFIEEYAVWFKNSDFDELVFDEYLDGVFDILSNASVEPSVDSAALYAYFKEEVKKPIYAKSEFISFFYDLMKDTATGKNEADFLKLQNQLLSKIKDKASEWAEVILDRIINFHYMRDEREKMMKVLSDNLQIVTFRKQLVHEHLKNKAWAAAKTLINDYLEYNRHHFLSNEIDEWEEWLLQIAQAEGDVKSIKQIALKKITPSFDAKYYEIYKATFSAEAWLTAVESLYKIYKSNLASSLTQLLVAEKDAAKLLGYVKSDTSIKRLVAYAPHFVAEFLAETLELFEAKLNQYAEKNMGRDSYELIVEQLKKMKAIENGEAVVQKMIAAYKTAYKSRKLLMELLATV
jgi:hypothetical protein